MTTSKEAPPPPEKPLPDECCSSGCVPCIYDYYYQALEKWEALYGKSTELSVTTETGNSEND